MHVYTEAENSGYALVIAQGSNKFFLITGLEPLVSEHVMRYVKSLGTEAFMERCVDLDDPRSLIPHLPGGPHIFHAQQLRAFRDNMISHTTSRR